MGRWRPPESPGSKYITPDGARRLREELDQLWKVERPMVTQAVAEAAAQGDRSENAEYTYGKRRLREIDRRVRFLRRRLDGMKVVDQPPTDTARVFFGAWVVLEADDGRAARHRIVGPDEFDLAEGYVSMDSPLGRALLGRRLDEEVVVRLPAGERHYTVVAIEYPRGGSTGPEAGAALTSGLPSLDELPDEPGE
jgi:transcription elongation factor GreB